MSKKNIKKLAVIGVVILVVILLYNVLIERVEFIGDNVTSIIVADLENEKTVKTNNAEVIKNVIDSANSIRLFMHPLAGIMGYLKYDVWLNIVGTSSPDAWIISFDENGNIKDSLEVYGNLASYRGRIYYILPLTKPIINEICDEYGK